MIKTSVQPEGLPSHLRGKSGDRKPPDGCILYMQTGLRGSQRHSFLLPGTSLPPHAGAGRPGPRSTCQPACLDRTGAERPPPARISAARPQAQRPPQAQPPPGRGRQSCGRGQAGVLRPRSAHGSKWSRPGTPPRGAPPGPGSLPDPARGGRAWPASRRPCARRTKSRAEASRRSPARSEAASPASPTRPGRGPTRPGGREGGLATAGRRVPPAAVALAAGTAPGGDGHFIRAKVESV